MAHLVGAEVRLVMAGFVIVSLEGRCSLRRMAAGFIDGHCRPLFAATWRPALFFKPSFYPRHNLYSMTRGLKVRRIPGMF